MTAATVRIRCSGVVVVSPGIKAAPRNQDPPRYTMDARRCAKRVSHSGPGIHTCSRSGMEPDAQAATGKAHRSGPLAHGSGAIRRGPLQGAAGAGLPLVQVGGEVLQADLLVFLRAVQEDVFGDAGCLGDGVDDLLA